jgi:SAM-dependent methyltransferase
VGRETPGRAAPGDQRPDHGRHDLERPFAERALAAASSVEVRAVYDAWAPTYDADHADDPVPDLVADLVARLVPPRTDVLDAPCGTGRVGVALARHGFTSIDGLDLAPRMVAVARRRRVYHDLGPADLSRRLPGAAAKFGVVTCVGGLAPGHLPPTALAEFARVVRPGGYIVIAVPDEHREALRLDRCLADLAAHGTAHPVAGGSPVLHRTSAGTLRIEVLEVPATTAAHGGG